jgi:winged helix DNA-binding protein
VSEVLGPQALNRATLARQMLLAREKTPPLRALERLAGLQAQVPRPPFVALWSRVQGFRPEALARLAHDRKVVRATMMRATLHLVSAADYVAWRPLMQPMLSAGMRGVLKDRSAGFDVEGVVRSARQLLQERPLTFDALRPLLKKAWPKADERALGYAVRTHLPLVQVPAETRWGWPASSEFSLADTWIGPLGGGDGLPAFVMRYLAALGPATVADAQNWSGLQGLKDAFEELRPKLRVFHDQRGRELFDLPKAPRPDATTPAPVRFLPDYDTLLLGHADRTRVVSDEHRKRLVTKNLQILAAFLVDGRVAGTWKAERARTAAALTLTPFESLARSARKELAEEGKALLQFLEPDAAKTEVSFVR